jgi:solute carrier family 25 S-adenosylmethionine transporter 26
MDLLKTIRQSNPTLHGSIASAFKSVIIEQRPVRRMYAGVTSSAIGAVPSSALYFGGYELMKRRLTAAVLSKEEHQRRQGGGGYEKAKVATAIESRGIRFAVHAISAASGNAASSALFVPKEVVKQHLQNFGGSSSSAAFHEILSARGVKGLYAGYRATLLRNIPGAVMRFGVYEELKLLVRRQGNSDVVNKILFFGCGAVAGSFSSALTTPLDVVKTQLALGKINQGVGVLGGIRQIYRLHGLQGVYAGAGARMLFSGCFSAVGFSVFEFAKGVMRVDGDVNHGGGGGGDDERIIGSVQGPPR